MPVIIDDAIKSYRLSLIKKSHQKYLAKHPRKEVSRSASDVLIDVCCMLLKKERQDRKTHFTLSPEEKALCGIV